jgi:hypothetical protein
MIFFIAHPSIQDTTAPLGADQTCKGEATESSTYAAISASGLFALGALGANVKVALGQKTKMPAAIAAGIFDVPGLLNHSFDQIAGLEVST